MSELATAGKPWSRKRTLKENAAMARASRHQRKRGSTCCL